MAAHSLWMQRSSKRLGVKGVRLSCSRRVVARSREQRLLIEAIAATAADAAAKSLSFIAAEMATSASCSIPTYSDNGGSTQTTTKSSAQETIQTSSSPASSSSPSSSNSGSDTLSTGALVGSIVASITGAIGSFAGVYFGYKTYKMKKEEQKTKDSEGQGQVVGD